MDKSKSKKIQFIDLNDYEEDLPLPLDEHEVGLPSAELHPKELPSPFVLSKEEEEKLIQEEIDAKKRREEHYINNPKYRKSPIPEDLLPDHKRRTPTPTMEMIKKDFDERRKEDRWGQEQKGGHHPFIIPLILLSGKYSMKRNEKNRETRKRKVKNMLKQIKKKNRSRFTKSKGKKTKKVRKGRKRNTRRTRK
jgi:hypothetical protein|uniref:Uncharacterized protein n=1 Tax=viral metagenome TaxID=1070528 RepID=A0A6C0IM62_9ZZZZ